MKLRQIIVDLIIIAVMAVVGKFCYDEGKAYDLIIDNVAYSGDGASYQAFEAVNVVVDGIGEPLYLVEGDRGVVTVPGRKHFIIVEELDEDDQVSKTHNVTFTNKELKGTVINIVPLVKDKLPGWSYPPK